MDLYRINGVEIEYDTFDIDNMERLEEAVMSIQKGMEALQIRKADGESPVKIVREQANIFLDFFDDVLGDGSARKIFGSKVNVLDIANGYKEFIGAVADQQSRIADAVGRPGDREQRRRARNAG